MRLHLIRHGRTDWNASRRVQGQLESHLDGVGREQARELGARLADVPFASLHVSSAARTRETAALVFEARPLPTAYHDDLREMRLGRWEGLMWDDVERAEPDEVARYRGFDESMDVEGAEGFAELQERGLAAIRRIVVAERDAGRGGADIAIVSHGAIIRAMLARWLDVPLPRFEAYPPLPNCAHCLVDVEARADGDAYRVGTIAGHAPERSVWAELFGGTPSESAVAAGETAPP